MEVVKQICHMRLFLRELGCVVFENNAAAIAFSKSGEHSKKTKHYMMKVHFLREKNDMDYSMMKV